MKPEPRAETSRIVITIETDNDAFADGNREAELARIFRKMAYLLETRGELPGRIVDINGNVVGTVDE